jgi:hypothetical protein
MRPRRTQTIFPPCAPGQRDDYLFEPDAEEIAALKRMKRRRIRHNEFTKKIESLSTKFEQQEVEYLRRKCQSLAAVVELDREWIQRQNEREAEVEQIRNYYLTEQDKERLARLKKLTEVLNKDINKKDRETLTFRGILKGKRKC